MKRNLCRQAYPTVDNTGAWKDLGMVIFDSLSLCNVRYLSTLDTAQRSRSRGDQGLQVQQRYLLEESFPMVQGGWPFVW